MRRLSGIRSFMARRRGGAVSSHFRGNFSRRGTGTVECKFVESSSNFSRSGTGTVECKFVESSSDALTELKNAQNTWNGKLTEVTDALVQLKIAHKSWGRMLFQSFVAQGLFLGAMHIPNKVELLQMPKMSPEQMRKAMEDTFIRTSI